jgi:hypothetical protein
MFITQNMYIVRIIAHLKMESCHFLNTPMEKRMMNCSPTMGVENVDPTLYKQIVRKLIYRSHGLLTHYCIHGKSSEWT